MALDTNLKNLTTLVSTDVKQLRTFLNGNVRNLDALTTTAKTSLVAAINEIADAAASASGIDDDAPNSTTTSYSASKVNAVVTASATATRDAILGGVGAAYDTLAEIAAQLAADEGVVSGILTALGFRLRVDVDNQGLTGTQQQNGRTNLDVWSKGEIGPVDTDYVALYQAGQA